jgi:hypothetical protein
MHCPIRGEGPLRRVLQIRAGHLIIVLGDVMEDINRELCDNPEAHVHLGPCDGFSYKGACSMCSGFVYRDDGTMIHDDGTIFAPVKIFQHVEYEVQLPRSLRREVNV